MASMKAILAPYLQRFQQDLLSQVFSSVPLLTQISQYYISQPSKRLRPCVILLMCQATNGLGTEWKSQSMDTIVKLSADSVPNEILSTQFCLAQIIELIHVASLLHDDVLDDADTRRGVPSAPVVFGNNRTILGGDFLLGKVLGLTAQLHSPEATTIIAKIICTLAEGEVIQADSDQVYDPMHVVRLPFVGEFGKMLPTDNAVLAGLWETYLLKTYMKTACLFSHALRCCVILGGSTAQDSLGELAAMYGCCLGMAFQLIDDTLDFEGSKAILGKPTNTDLGLGLATAPVFFALQEDSELLPRVLRKFTHPGDVEKVSESVRNTQALANTRKLAEFYAGQARETLTTLPDSVAKTTLQELTAAILIRQE